MALSVQLYSQLLTTREQAGNDEPGKSLPLFSLSLSEHVVFESDSFMSIDCIVDHQCGSLCLCCQTQRQLILIPIRGPWVEKISLNAIIRSWHITACLLSFYGPFFPASSHDKSNESWTRHVLPLNPFPTVSKPAFLGLVFFWIQSVASIGDKSIESHVLHFAGAGNHL